MKKLLTILMIFMALFAFIACENGNIGNDNSNVTVNPGNSNNGSNGGNGGNSGNSGNGGNSGNTDFNPDKFAEEFKDCSTTIDAANVSFADGEWTVIGTYSDEASSQVITVQATVKDGYFTYTSGTMACTFDVEKMFQQMPEDEMPEEIKQEMIAALKAATDEEKTAMMEELQGEMPAGAKITWNGLIYSGSFPFDQEWLNDFNEELQFSEYLEEFAVKTNADNTKYVLSCDENETYYLQKN